MPAAPILTPRNATPLHYAASHNKVDIVDLLLRRGAVHA
jgi:ankyrin repeat protein